MRSKRVISIISCHTEGEVGDVVVGGVLNVPAKTMYDKLVHYMTRKDDLRKFLLGETRGRLEMSVNLVVRPCRSDADAGFLIMAPGDWVPMSGSNTGCTTTVLLETGIVPMNEPITEVRLDTAAGLVVATIECRNGKSKSISFDNVPAFVYALDKEIDVHGLGKVHVDIAYGGQWCVVAQAKSLGVKVETANGDCLIDLRKQPKSAVLAQRTPTHPDNPTICSINNVIITEPLVEGQAFYILEGPYQGQLATAVLTWIRDMAVRGRDASTSIPYRTLVVSWNAEGMLKQQGNCVLC